MLRWFRYNEGFAASQSIDQENVSVDEGLLHRDHIHMVFRMRLQLSPYLSRKAKGYDRPNIYSRVIRGC